MDTASMDCAIVWPTWHRSHRGTRTLMLCHVVRTPRYQVGPASTSLCNPTMRSCRVAVVSPAQNQHCRGRVMRVSRVRHVPITVRTRVGTGPHSHALGGRSRITRYGDVIQGGRVRRKRGYRNPHGRPAVRDGYWNPPPAERTVVRALLTRAWVGEAP
ncbi:hypothetical protein GCM10010376_31840 [Streptomyces violaceusniger]